MRRPRISPRVRQLLLLEAPVGLSVAYATGASQGAQIKLLNVQKRVHDLIQITKLYTVFESFTSEPAALESLAAKAAAV